ncbi:DUF866 domain-containing protein [Providencia rettgeri]
MHNKNNYQWVDGKNLTVKCPECSSSVTVQIERARELNLRVRDAECDHCLFMFDVRHDGKTEFTPRKKINEAEKKQLIDNINKIIFDPDGEDD